MSRSPKEFAGTALPADSNPPDGEGRGLAVSTAGGSPAAETGGDDSTRATLIHRNDYETALPSHYKLVEMVGRGGMAEVFRARDERLGRNVAIKFLNAEFRRDPDRMRRFDREARAASALNHPNILVIHDIGEGDGVQYIVGEYVDGEPLSRRIARGRLPIAEAVDVAIQIASALDASHKAGIVHRDVKPDNIMVRRDGVVKVLDFGLAKDTLDGRDLNGHEAVTLAPASTSPGMILGTPQYMSPEQARGQVLDGRTDIFGLGVTFFEMLTGRLPFEGKSTADVIAAIIAKEPRRIEEDVENPPLELVRIVGRCLQKDRDDRYASADRLLADLKELRTQLSGTPSVDVRATDGSRVETAVRPGTIRTVADSIVHRPSLALVGLVAVVAIVVGWYVLRRPSTAAPSVPAGTMRTIPVTSWNSTASEPGTSAAFSPQGNMVAFSATRSGATEIWVKPAGGGEAIQVTRDGYYNQYPVWSPDGQEIAFFSSRANYRGIWRVSFTGGEQRQVVSGVGPTARPTRWTPDGKIYYQEGPELFEADTSSGERRQLTSFRDRGLEPRTIAISADASELAYSVRENGQWHLKVEKVGSTSPTEIANSKDQIDNIVWQPGGEAVLFSGSADGAYQIFEVSTSGGTPVQLSNGSLDCVVQDVAGDGSRILYNSVSETSDLWSVDVREGRQAIVANEMTAEMWPDVAPDGRKVVYESVSQVDKIFAGTVKVADIAEAGRPAVAVAAVGVSPIWSPDGGRIAFFRRGESGISIWSFTATGDGAVKIAEGDIAMPDYVATPYIKAGGSQMSWSPDSRFVAYGRKADGVANIWIAAADGSSDRALTANKDQNEILCCASWSADGKTLVYASRTTAGPNRTASYRLRIVKLENGEDRGLFESPDRFSIIGFASPASIAIAQNADLSKPSAVPDKTDIRLISVESGAVSPVMTLGNAYFQNIKLSPDGKTIAFVTRRDDRSALWTVPVAGGTPKQQLIENDPKVLISSMVWTPDGHFLVFGKQTRTNLISLLAK